MQTLNLWEGMSLKWQEKATFEEYASEAIPAIERLMIRQLVIASLLFVGGLVFLYFDAIVLGAAFLLLAVHYDQQSSKSHMLLFLTAYHRAMARTLAGQSAAGSSAK